MVLYIPIEHIISRIVHTVTLLPIIINLPQSSLVLAVFYCGQNYSIIFLIQCEQRDGIWGLGSKPQI